MSDAAAPATISGDCHSLFQVQGRAQLALRHVRLEHSCAPAEDGGVKYFSSTLPTISPGSTAYFSSRPGIAWSLDAYNARR